MIYLIAFLMTSIFFVLACVIGFGVAVNTKREKADLIHVYTDGMPAIIIAFIILAFVGSLLHIKLTYIGLFWLAIIFVYILYLFAFNRKNMIKYMNQGIRNSFATKNRPLPICIFRTIIVLLIVLQIIMCIGFSYNQPDVIRFIPNAVKAYETGIMSVSSPMLMFYAWLSKICHMHPMTLIMSVMPAVLIPLYYAVAYRVFRQLIGDEFKVMFAMFIYNLLNLWGFHSTYTTELVMLFSYFSGLCIAIYIYAPMIMCLLVERYGKYIEFSKKSDIYSGEKDDGPVSDGKNINEINEDDLSDEEWEELDMKKHRIINARNLAIALLVVVIAMMAVILFLNRKINSLYNLEVDLQQRIGQNAVVYEFIPQGEKTPAAYIISQNGTGFSVIGSASESSASELCDYILGNGETVENWYLHSASPEDVAAYEYCVSKGVVVEHVYYMGVEELK